MVFSADLAVGGDAGWVHVVNQDMLSFDAVDMGGDPTAEIVFATLYDINPANQADEENIVVRVLNAATGAVEFTGNYPVIRP